MVDSPSNRKVSRIEDPPSQPLELSSEHGLGYAHPRLMNIHACVHGASSLY